MVILGLKTGYLRVTHPFAMVLLPFDLHVLGTPPALILSQDQTLQKNLFLFCFYFSFLLILLKELLVCNSCSSYIVFKDLVLHGFVSRAFSLYLILKTCQQLFYSFLQIFFVIFSPIYIIYVDKKEKSPSLIE